MSTMELRRGEKRAVIERMLDDGMTTGTIAKTLNCDLGYVSKVRKIWGGSIRDYSKDTAYQSPEWYAENDKKFRAKIEQLRADGGGW